MQLCRVVLSSKLLWHPCAANMALLTIVKQYKSHIYMYTSIALLLTRGGDLQLSVTDITHGKRCTQPI